MLSIAEIYILAQLKKTTKTINYGFYLMAHQCDQSMITDNSSYIGYSYFRSITSELSFLKFMKNIMFLIL